MENTFKAEMAEPQAFVEDEEEELAYLKEQQGDVGKEEEKWIDEDDAKIKAVETMLGGAEDSKQLEEKSQRVEGQVCKERKHLADLEDRQIELIKEKEEAIDELEHARRDIVGLEKKLRDRDIRDRGINERAIKSLETCDDPFMMDDSCLIDMEALEPQPPYPLPASMSVSEPDDNVVTYIERLLAAIDRLRGERDSLRRDVQFLESESRFTIEALEAKLSASTSSASNDTVTTISQLKTEMDDLHSHLAKVSEQNAATVASKNFEIKRLGLAVQTLAVTLDHTSSQAKISETRSLLLAQDELQASQDDVLEKERHLQDLEKRLDAIIADLEAMTSQRDALLAELQCKSSQWEKELETTRTAERETREELEDVLHRILEVATHLQDVESERDSLRLQITNLMTDMRNVQEELTDAESRYTSLQFHQLSDMTNNEATRNLRGQIEELENRVMRRTEQIGIHQHDIKRLETNLRLQEERLGEMTTELEMMAAQKDAMVEDCADARKARDETLIRVERLEEELEDQQLSSGDSDRKIVQFKLEHAEAIGVLQARLGKMSSDLEGVQARYNLAQDAHQRTLQEANSSNLELERRLGAATQKLVELEQFREQYTEDLNRIRKEHAIQVDRSQDENRAVKQELEQKVASLQGQFEEQGHLLDISKREAARTCYRLQEEVEGRAQDKKHYTMTLLSAKERNEDADETISQLRGELETLEGNLQQTNVHLQSIADENIILQQQTTALQAEIQRSKSLIDYLEIQIKDSDQLIATLKGDIERINADLARSEKSWKSAEVNLSLQNAQHKREMTELHRELSMLQSRPNFEQALAELEERNSEMEELLRNKCAEIEENDDRALEMLKEKKKLTAKVESLTRKVQHLQAKLTAAKTSNVVQPSHEPQPTPPVPSLPLTSPTLQSTSAPISRPRSITVSSAPPIYPSLVETPTSRTRNPSNRVVSGPSFLPRPKTPEARTVTPVFKARTPERQIQHELVPIPPVPVIGRKRPMPDEFEAYEILPTQAFTADGEDIENRTPRVRKVLNSLQSGFTPVRNQNSHSTVVMPSPRRGAPSRTSPFIADLTNSPHYLSQTNANSSAKPSKRSWLGKIRGNSQVTDRRSLFDRGHT